MGGNNQGYVIRAGARFSAVLEITRGLEIFVLASGGKRLHISSGMQWKPFAFATFFGSGSRERFPHPAV